ncbi:MAG: tryptophan synthase subunit beta, partial [Spirochaetota bacterium]
DYAGIGPQLAHLGSIGRLRFISASDEEALAALDITARDEGVLSALESAHAIAGALRELPLRSRDEIAVINVSGRGDKDLFITAPLYDKAGWLAFLEAEVVRLRGGEER